MHTDGKTTGRAAGSVLMKILKYVFWGLGAFILIAGILIAYVAATFDPRDYHARVIELVKTKTGRTLQIQGDVGLSYWPDIGVQLGALTLSERDSNASFASVESARLVLKLRPLLRRELIVDELVVVGANVHIRRSADGRLNIDDLFAGEGGPPRFDIGRLAIERSAIDYRDAASGAQYEVTGIALETGRLANTVATPITLRMSARNMQDTFRVQASIRGQLTFDLEQQVHTLERAGLEVKGKLPGMDDVAAQATGNVIARLRTSELHVSELSAALGGKRGQDLIEAKANASSVLLLPERSAADSVNVAITAKGPAGTSHVKLLMPSLRRDADRFQSESAALEMALQRGAHRVQAAVATALEGSLAARALTLTKINANFVVGGPSLPPKGLAGTLTGTARLDTEKEGVQAQLAGKVGDSKLKARVAAAGFAAPVYTFDVDIDELDLDRYMSADQPSARKSTGAGTQPVDDFLAALEDLPASGTLSIGVLKASNAKATNVKLVVK